MDPLILRTRLLNHGQSEVLIEGEGVLGEPKMVATNAVLHVIQQYSSPEIWAHFIAAKTEQFGVWVAVSLREGESACKELNLTL